MKEIKTPMPLPPTSDDIICWWSGGITSAVACMKAIEIYGRYRCKVIMIDTMNEHEDTYRFKVDCEEWYKLKIHTIKNDKYNSIQEVWDKYNSLNVAHGAVCSSELKRVAREIWQKNNNYTHQVFGFEFDKKEFNRAKSLVLNHSITNPIFPLIMFGLDKDDCIDIVRRNNIEIPEMYNLGFKNNNCFGTGCVQGGIGYWKKMQLDFPDKFKAMALLEHKLTERKNKPVTMLKDQSNKAKKSGNFQVFLTKNNKYPELKCLDNMESREVLPLKDCNGLCGVDDLNKINKTSLELNNV